MSISIIAVVQLLSLVWLFVIPWTAACQAPLSFTIFQNLLKFMSIKSVMLSNHLILCHSLLLLPSIFPSPRGFSSESVLGIRWPKYWSFSFSISTSNEYSAWISFRIDLLAVQRTLKSLLQHHKMNGLRKFDIHTCIYTMEYYQYLAIKNFCHLKQHGWT